MFYLNLAGIIVTALLIMYKINYFVEVLQDKKNKNPLKTLVGIYGVCAGLVFGGAALLAFEIYAVPGFYIQLADLFISLLIMTIIDVKWKVIPNALTLTLLVSQLVSAFTCAQTGIGWLSAVVSIIVLLVLMLVSRMTNEQIGMGDVKLIAVMNLIYGISFILYSMIFAMICMLVCTIPLLILRKISMKSSLPFVPFYFIGVIIYTILNLI